MSVKQILSHVLIEIRRGRVGSEESHRRDPCLSAHRNIVVLAVLWAARLTVAYVMRHNYNYYGSTTSPRCQGRGLACPRRAPSPARDGARPPLRVARLLRSPGSRAGEVRNAAPGGRGGPARRAHGRRVRRLAADVLSDAGRVRRARDRRIGAPETRAARGAQSHRRGVGFCGGAANAGPRAADAHSAVTGARPLWARRAPAESRARLATAGKKRL